MLEREILLISKIILRFDDKYIFIETLILGNGGTLRFFNGTLGKSLLSGICSYLFSSLDINILAKMLA